MNVEEQQNSRNFETQTIISENGQDVLWLGITNGRMQVLRGTVEKLFLRLADETTQGKRAIIMFSVDYTILYKFLILRLVSIHYKRH